MTSWTKGIRMTSYMWRHICMCPVHQNKFSQIVSNSSDSDHSDSNYGLVDKFGKGFGEGFEEIATRVKSVRFIVQRTPYIHIPCNKYDVLELFEFR